MKACQSVCRSNSIAGYSMLEVVVAIAIMFIVSGIAVTNITGSLPVIQANSALNMTVAQLRKGREAAIAQRREIQLQFLNNKDIRLVRTDVPAGTTVLGTTTLTDGMQFQLFGGLPDTPDGFGNAAAVDFGGANTVTFLTDGTLVDAAGNPLSGTVYIGLPNNPQTARAVTILGATGRVRGYRWTGTQWIK